MKKIFLTLSIVTTLGLVSAQAQTQGTTGTQQQNTVGTDSTMNSPMEGQTEDNMQQDTTQMNQSEQNMGTMEQDTARTGSQGMGEGTESDQIRGAKSSSTIEADTIRYNEPVMDRRYKNPRSTDSNRKPTNTGDPK